MTPSRMAVVFLLLLTASVGLTPWAEYEDKKVAALAMLLACLCALPEVS